MAPVLQKTSAINSTCPHFWLPFLAQRTAPSGQPPAGEGTMAGKRYADAESGVEVLCTKAGQDDLAFAGRPLERKDAKPLPASD